MNKLPSRVQATLPGTVAVARAIADAGRVRDREPVAERRPNVGLSNTFFESSVTKPHHRCKEIGSELLNQDSSGLVMLSLSGFDRIKVQTLPSGFGLLFFTRSDARLARNATATACLSYRAAGSVIRSQAWSMPE